MSKRRKAGEIVKRKPGSGFLGSTEPSLIKLLPEEKGYESWCVLECGDNKCREWANCKVVGTEEYLYHISECEMEDKPTSKLIKEENAGGKEGFLLQSFEGGWFFRVYEEDKSFNDYNLGGGVDLRIKIKDEAHKPFSLKTFEDGTKWLDFSSETLGLKKGL